MARARLGPIPRTRSARSDKDSKAPPRSRSRTISNAVFGPMPRTEISSATVAEFASTAPAVKLAQAPETASAVQARPRRHALACLPGCWVAGAGRCPPPTPCPASGPGRPVALLQHAGTRAASGLSRNVRHASAGARNGFISSPSRLPSRAGAGLPPAPSAIGPRKPGQGAAQAGNIGLRQSTSCTAAARRRQPCGTGLVMGKNRRASRWPHAHDTMSTPLRPTMVIMYELRDGGLMTPAQRASYRLRREIT